MTDFKKIGEYLFCLGGFNPLCWTGCSSDENEPPSSDCYDDTLLKKSDSIYESCKGAVCAPVKSLSASRSPWTSQCGFYNFNGKCFPLCDEDSIKKDFYVKDYLKLYNKLCLESGRGIRTEWKKPEIFAEPPSHYEKPEWCFLDFSDPDNAWIPTAPFQPQDKEKFARFLVEGLGWEIETGFFTKSKEDQNIQGTKLNDPKEIVETLSWRGAVPVLGLDDPSTNCGLFCALMDSINRLVGHPHLLKLLKNPEGHQFVFLGGTIQYSDFDKNPLAFVGYKRGIESSIMVVDADKVMKLFLCAHGMSDQDSVNRFLSFVISHEFGHIFQNPPDLDSIPYVYEQLGFDYLYLFLEAAFDVYRLSPPLERGEGITHMSGGLGFVSGYDQEENEIGSLAGIESFAEEAAFYLYFGDSFRQYVREDASQNDYFLATKYLFLAERFYCDDVGEDLFSPQR